MSQSKIVRQDNNNTESKATNENIQANEHQSGTKGENTEVVHFDEDNSGIPELDDENEVANDADGNESANHSQSLALAVNQPGHLQRNRPVSSNQFKLSHTISESGIRPVAASTLKVSEYIMNRPIASNESEETEEIIGYLD